MNVTRLMVALLGVGVSVLCVGALVSLVANTLLGPFTASAGSVILLVVGALLLAVAVGARGGDWLDNPGYW